MSLEPASTVIQVTTATHAVVNPLTTSGTILAAGPTGAPVVSSVLPKWSASFLDAAFLYPLPYSAAAAAAYLFPSSVQAFYDEQLEPLFTYMAQGLKDLKAAIPSPVALAILFRCLLRVLHLRSGKSWPPLRKAARLLS